MSASSRSASSADVELSIVMPCLDEAETLGTCIDKALEWARSAGIATEVVVADNGSSDGAREIAVGRGGRVVRVDDRGYGSALMGGIVAARGRYVIMGDADDTYDFGDLSPFLERLRTGDQLVMGNRFAVPPRARTGTGTDRSAGADPRERGGRARSRRSTRRRSPAGYRTKPGRASGRPERADRRFMRTSALGSQSLNEMAIAAPAHAAAIRRG